MVFLLALRWLAPWTPPLGGVLIGLDVGLDRRSLIFLPSFIGTFIRTLLPLLLPLPVPFVLVLPQPPLRHDAGVVTLNSAVVRPRFLLSDRCGRLPRYTSAMDTKWQSAAGAVARWSSVSRAAIAIPVKLMTPFCLGCEHAHKAIRWVASTYGDTVVAGGCSVLLRR